ncbi:MAG TPA: MBL fold metallo-hydrolase [Streptosporangiaceae bacterium]|nr:MBL fold metallo-hydrolase [Streptosporangiaceae bacterium]
MRLTKYTHSCVRLEIDGVVLVIDPGTWSEAYALPGCDAVLVTHEHTDHIDVLRLKGLSVPVYAPADAEISGLDNLRRVHPGTRFTAAGVEITATGGQHASVVPGQRACANLGYIVSDLLYHPGDSLALPGQPVQTLLVPMQAAWLKTSEAIAFVQAISPERAFGIHDAQINERGLSSINGWLSGTAGETYRWLAPGQQA